MFNSNQSSKVTVESLLQLKRTERPAADFWVSFERELRQKQLSALVEKRSWWQDLPPWLVRRAYLPIGATAILTFTLVSIKYYSPTSIAGQTDDVVQSGSSTLAMSQSTPASVLEQGAPVGAPLFNRAESAPTEEAYESPAFVAKASAQVPSSKVESNVRLVSREPESPSALSIAANLAHFAQSDPELVNAFLGSRLSPPRVQMASVSTAELVSIPTNGSKRARFLAHYNDRQVNPKATAPDNVRERLARRWSDDDANDRFSRIGLKGDQFSLKF